MVTVFVLCWQLACFKQALWIAGSLISRNLTRTVMECLQNAALPLHIQKLEQALNLDCYLHDVHSVLKSWPLALPSSNLWVGHMTFCSFLFLFHSSSWLKSQKGKRACITVCVYLWKHSFIVLRHVLRCWNCTSLTWLWRERERLSFKFLPCSSSFLPIFLHST